MFLTLKFCTGFKPSLNLVNPDFVLKFPNPITFHLGQHGMPHREEELATVGEKGKRKMAQYVCPFAHLETGLCHGPLRAPRLQRTRSARSDAFEAGAVRCRACLRIQYSTRCLPSCLHFLLGSRNIIDAAAWPGLGFLFIFIAPLAAACRGGEASVKPTFLSPLSLLSCGCSATSLSSRPRTPKAHGYR
jgi:hypothetical protein